MPRGDSPPPLGEVGVKQPFPFPDCSKGQGPEVGDSTGFTPSTPAPPGMFPVQLT